jgi:peptidoglycan/LPS O-acetylase OafA/YrhL
MHGSPKFIFANQLRGLAAVCVLLSHFAGVYWGNPDNLISNVTYAPAPAADLMPTDFVALFSNSTYNFGPLGVGIFFLISGFVISISLQTRPAGTFLLARFLRIYPTYVAALAVEVVTLKISSMYWGQQAHMHWHTLAMNALLIHAPLGLPSFDFVNWTLAIEVKFYIIMAFSASIVRQGNVQALCAIALALLNVVLFSAADAAPIATLPALSSIARTEGPFLIFMLIGVLFNFRARGLLTQLQLVVGCAFFMVIFAASWRTSLLAPIFHPVAINYVYALAIFGTCFAFRAYAKSFWVLDKLANISYPLYLVHSLVGYTVLRMLMVGHGVSYGIAFVLAAAAAIVIATVLHVFVERPTMIAGQRLVVNGWRISANDNRPLPRLLRGSAIAVH